MATLTQEKGFSLFEMLVVLIIISVIAVMATPAVGRLMDGLSYRRHVSDITNMIRYARLQSISSGDELRLSLDEEEACVFRLSGPVNETRDCGLEEDDVLTMEPGEIMFFPEGTATPGMITFEKGDRIKKIRIDLLTALPVTQS